MKYESGIRFLSPVARLLMAFIFVAAGLSKISGWNAVSAYMGSKGIPLVSVFLALTIMVEIGGGLALALGYKTRTAAALLFIYLVPVTLVLHNFWAYQGLEAQNQLVNFMKNFAIMGGLLNVAVNGAGAYGIDMQTQKHAGPEEMKKAA